MPTLTTLDLRGRDLIITPPDNLVTLPTPDLLAALFGTHLPTQIQAKIGRDKRFHFLRTQPIHFTMVKQALRQQQTPFTVAFDEQPTLPFTTTLSIEPRPYQEDALTAWLAEGSTGVVILPTGAGKTFVAAMAIAETGQWTLAVVPTLDLLQQWRVALSSALSLSADEIGIFGGGEKELKPITIITYDSAALYPRELRRFGLLVFDIFCVIDEC
jgi:Type III restriction enzyme, res subunit